MTSYRFPPIGWTQREWADLSDAERADVIAALPVSARAAYLYRPRLDSFDLDKR
ncbi:hypothetical protein OG746_29295 [Streptomyces sp. NBC_01016]|uniref:hypothetical protein n=1 Tax=Streptomyces sp. NBC_01016 TaxID=2903720 RepID=UPI00225278DE|nr:hypothetical protein [Streptomyces sp. NBC_01016]MCX4832834.1 hypothetical protein [Streptomyces sp. NBC_01016]